MGWQGKLRGYITRAKTRQTIFCKNLKQDSLISNVNHSHPPNNKL